jgi:hypothetical protein
MKPLIDIGDPKAPRGSEPWCRSFHQTICRLKREGQFAVSNLKYSLREFRDGEHFRKMTTEHGRPFKSWESFVSYREPFGLGMDPAVVTAIMNEADDKKLLEDVLGKHGGDRRSEKAKADQGCDDTTLKRGTAEYWMARLKRDRPDFAVRVRSGELTANAAAEQLRWRKKPKKQTRIEKMDKLWARMTRSERREWWSRHKKEF